MKNEESSKASHMVGKRRGGKGGRGEPEGGRVYVTHAVGRDQTKAAEELRPVCLRPAPCQ